MEAYLFRAVNLQLCLELCISKFFPSWLFFGSGKIFLQFFFQISMSPTSRLHRSWNISILRFQNKISQKFRTTTNLVHMMTYLQNFLEYSKTQFWIHNFLSTCCFLIYCDYDVCVFIQGWRIDAVTFIFLVLRENYVTNIAFPWGLLLRKRSDKLQVWLEEVSNCWCICGRKWFYEFTLFWWYSECMVWFS